MIGRAASWRGLLWTAVLLGVCPLASAAQERERDVTTRVILHPHRVFLPVGPCTIASAAAFIAEYLEIPSGVEMLPGPCSAPGQPPPRNEVSVQGMTVADALNKLVELDPRFYWTATDGVIVMRPLAAWTDPKHFLHEKLPSLTLENANIGQALHAAVEPLRPGKRGLGDDLMAGVSSITLSTGPISIVEGLEAIVRTDARARFEVRYCLPEPRIEYATVWIYTFDKRGIGTRVRTPLDTEGKTYDPCKGKF